MSAQEKKEVTTTDEKLLRERAKSLADMIKKIRSTCTVNRGVAIAMESILPGLLPSTMPVASFTEEDSPTNVSALLKLLNEQYEEVVLEAFHVAASRGRSVADWVQKAEADGENLSIAAQTIDLLVGTQKPTSDRFVALLQKARSEKSGLFTQATTETRLFDIAEDANAKLTAILQRGAVACLIDLQSPSRYAIYDIHQVFRTPEGFAANLKDAIIAADDLLFDGEYDFDFGVKNTRLDEYRQKLGFPVETPKSELGKAFLYMVEKMLDQASPVAYDYDSYMTETIFDMQTLSASTGYGSVYQDAAEKTEALFEKLQKEWKSDIETPGMAIAIANRISDAWAAVEVVFRAQARLYTEITRSIHEIQSIVYAVMEVMERTTRILEQGGMEGTTEILTDCQIYFKSVNRDTISDLY